MIESTVCECWEDESPGGFESVSDWIDAANSHHLEESTLRDYNKHRRVFVEIYHTCPQLNTIIW
jgi:hypothetical protein